MSVITPVRDTASEQAVFRKVVLRIVPFLMLCYVISYLDRVNVGFAKLQMSSDLGFSEAAFGLGAGLFFIGYFFFEVPSNMILQKVGAKVWIARIMITWGIVSGSFMFVNNEIVFYILRFLLGVAEAGFYPGVIFYCTLWFPAHRRARVIAMFMSAIPLAGIFGNPLSGWIMGTFDEVGGLGGWQWMFIIEAIPAILVGIWTLFYLDSSVQKAKWLTQEEKDIVEAAVAEDSSHQTPPAAARRVPRAEGVADVPDLLLLRHGPVRPDVLDADVREVHRHQLGADDRRAVGNPVPRRADRDEPVRPFGRSSSGTSLAPDHPGADGRRGLLDGGGDHRIDGVGADLAVDRRGRRAHLRSAVLVVADGVPGRLRGRGRYRGGQLGRKPRRFRQPVHDRRGQGRHRLDRGADVHPVRDSALVGALCVFSTKKDVVNR